MIGKKLIHTAFIYCPFTYNMVCETSMKTRCIIRNFLNKNINENVKNYDINELCLFIILAIKSKNKINYYYALKELENTHKKYYKGFYLYFIFYPIFACQKMKKNKVYVDLDFESVEPIL